MQRFSPYAAFQANASRQPEHDAIVFADLRISYGECAERVTTLAGWLLREGFAPGELPVFAFATRSIISLSSFRSTPFWPS